jgi:hypothetical protein
VATLRNISPLGDLDVVIAGCTVPAGGTFDVPASVAGRPPDGDDLGEGLLAQAENFELVKPPRKTAAKKTAAATTSTSSSDEQKGDV